MKPDDVAEALLDAIDAVKAIHGRTIFQGASQPLLKYRDEFVAWKERTKQLLRTELGREAARNFEAVADPGVLGPTVDLLDTMAAKYESFLADLAAKVRTARVNGGTDEGLPVPAFASFSSKDDEHLARLKVALAVLERHGLLKMWEFRNLEAGTDWDAEIRKHLHASKLILLLVSPDFLASRYSIEEELATALQRHAAGNARLVPIIVRPCDWLHTDLKKLQALPQDGKPITEWSNADVAWQNVTNGIRRVIESLRQASSPGKSVLKELTPAQVAVLETFRERGCRSGEGMPINVFVGDRDAMEAVETLVGSGALSYGKNSYVRLTECGFEMLARPKQVGRGLT